MSRFVSTIVRSHQRPWVARRLSSSLMRSQQRPEALAAPLFTPEFYESEAAARRYYYYIE